MLFVCGDLRKLAILKIAVNQIETIADDAFVSLLSLNKLILYDNPVDVNEQSQFFAKLINLEDNDDDNDD